ncbi:PepSY-associated TM helix domain-containing protein [Novosphingobium sp. 9U]|uniref:PepSY-associated TM helix domain-containing protein n=1 Tax=Novosphingobium sp. 9U TaxID=2653158 RepID=UPI0012F0523B|nr:PepSY-associated TM helix domain-containing protein [Novosphingobium sp. 9U]VWX52879.1 Membrane protein [Novosphingobium sp. 9U]
MFHSSGKSRTLEAVELAEPAAAPRSATQPARTLAAPRKSRKVRTFWLKQLHTWHWISAAISLAAMLLFSVTGLTLNHAASIAAEPVVTQSNGRLPMALVESLPKPGDSHAPLPDRVAAAVAKVVPLDPAGFAADWSDEGEVYVAMPGPGRDAWVSIDRTTGAVSAERTERGWISYVNDLHKGRNTGSAWFWFIDVFAVACLVFTITGLVLLQLHSKHRPATWPLVGLSLAIPVIVAVFFIH